MAQINRVEPATDKGRSVMERVAAGMPKWPAYVMLGAAAACAYPAVTTPPPLAEIYRARGQEPGWVVMIADGKLDYAGDYGATRITVPRPTPRATVNGYRYETRRLTVDVTHSRCNDAMSGHGYPDPVTVIAAGKRFPGCGGERRSDWDI